ncbi:hypothetical protein J6590_023165 [Homalodisca vitripennis]|nr:hypothetical protein J6590_023165 [Homalodisca vitripennis]
MTNENMCNEILDPIDNDNTFSQRKVNVLHEDKFIFRQDKAYVPPLPQNLEELKNWICTAITSVMKDLHARVWKEFEYRCEIVRVADGGHIEHFNMNLRGL